MRTAGDAFFVRARRGRFVVTSGALSRLGCGVVHDVMIFSCAARFARGACRLSCRAGGVP